MKLPEDFARWREAARSDQIVMVIVAALTGVAVAYAAIGFRLGIGAIQWVGFGVFGERTLETLSALPWWHIMLVPAAGGLLVGLLLHFALPDRRPQGVAHVIEAMALRNGRMSLRQGFWAAIVNVTSLGAGASAGREGPVVHLGATLASETAFRLGLPSQMARTLLGCGVAAAVAASFNAPIAGVFFALEVIVGHYALSAFAPVVVASVAGTVICRVHLGALPAFQIPPFDIVSAWEFPAFMLLGILCACIAMIFMWSIFFAEKVVESLPVPVWLTPAAGGLAVGALAVEFPQILGVGYEATDAALNELLPLWLLVGLIMLKTAATAITIGCRFGGGVFSPSLYLGAMTGGAFGLIASQVFPELAASHGAYAIVGMSALAAAVLGAPISTILIVFELTSDYTMTVAVMIATVFATLIVQRVIGVSFFHWQLRNRGLHLTGGRARHLLRLLSVADLMVTDYEKVSERSSVGNLKQLFQDLPHSTLVVVDEDDRLVGPVSFSDLKHTALDPEIDLLLNAADVAHTGAPVLTPDESLERALSIMDVSGEDHLAVVVSREDRKVIGMVHHKDVLRAYNKALLQGQAEEHDEAAPTR